MIAKIWVFPSFWKLTLWKARRISCYAAPSLLHQCQPSTYSWRSDLGELVWLEARDTCVLVTWCLGLDWEQSLGSALATLGTRPASNSLQLQHPASWKLFWQQLLILAPSESFCHSWKSRTFTILDSKSWHQWVQLFSRPSNSSYSQFTILGSVCCLLKPNSYVCIFLVSGPVFLWLKYPFYNWSLSWWGRQSSMFPFNFGPLDRFQVLFNYIQYHGWYQIMNMAILLNMGSKCTVKQHRFFYMHGTLWLVWVKKCCMVVLVLRGRAFRTQMSWDRWRSIHRFGFNPPPLTHPVFKRQLSVVIFCRSFL